MPACCRRCRSPSFERRFQVCYDDDGAGLECSGHSQFFPWPHGLRGSTRYPIYPSNCIMRDACSARVGLNLSIITSASIPHVSALQPSDSESESFALVLRAVNQFMINFICIPLRRLLRFLISLDSGFIEGSGTRSNQV